MSVLETELTLRATCKRCSDNFVVPLDDDGVMCGTSVDEDPDFVAKGGTNEVHGRL